MDPQVRSWLQVQKALGETLILAKDPLALSDVLGLQPQPLARVAAQPPAIARPVAGPASSPASAQNLSQIQTIGELRKAVEAFEGCALKRTALHTVFCDGDVNSPVMFIGEAPGAEEDKQGLPFVGQSGLLLNKMLSAIGFSRSQVYITNVVYWRPPGNRTPDPDEIALCLPFLERHIELMQPKVVVLLGATAMRAVLGLPSGLSRARGRWHQHVTPTGQTFPTMVTFHPSYLLRSPGQKALAWQDFMMLQEALA